MITRLATTQADFSSRLQSLRARCNLFESDVINQTQTLLDDIEKQGDAAILNYAKQIDGVSANTIAELCIEQHEMEQAFNSIDEPLREALVLSHQRINDFHTRQIEKDWEFTDKTGMTLGQKVNPIARAGLYVPGGLAAYPSSLLMNAVPARVAGVEEIIMVSPMQERKGSSAVLAAAHIVGVDKAFILGGAQAVGALAFGTSCFEPVDKIVGPGNTFVTAAKRALYGRVGIDMVAGPSEVLVIADGTTPPKWVAADLIAQAEHDPEAQAILLSPDESFINLVEQSLKAQVTQQKRREIIEASLSENGVLIGTRDLKEAIDLANLIAPEHLELVVSNPRQYLDKIKHAGAIFLGAYASEALGDYLAGPNHVLPTARTARFFSPLGVSDFQKKSSVIEATQEAAKELGRLGALIAKAEGLEAHQHALELRFEAVTSNSKTF